MGSAAITLRPVQPGGEVLKDETPDRGKAWQRRRTEGRAVGDRTFAAPVAARADNRLVDGNRSRVVLADDDVLLREGLASLLDRSGLEVVGQAGDAGGLLELVGRLQPELAVVDIRMPPKHGNEGLEAARVIRRDFPGTAVVVLSAHVEVKHALDLLAAGHRTGYLLKSRVTDVTEFIDTLKRVERGGAPSWWRSPAWRCCRPTPSRGWPDSPSRWPPRSPTRSRRPR